MYPIAHTDRPGPKDCQTPDRPAQFPSQFPSHARRFAAWAAQTVAARATVTMFVLSRHSVPIVLVQQGQSCLYRPEET